MLEDITTRLERALNASCSFANNLKPALDLASQQLELLTPAVMGASRKGIVATIATTVPIGTWLIVLANRRKVFTAHIQPPPPPYSRLDAVEQCVAYAEDVAAQAGMGVPNQADILRVIDTVVSQHGGQPGAKTPQLDQHVIMRIFGLLFSAHTKPQRAELVEGVEQAIAANLCPVHVGLLGRGTNKGTSAGIWPLGLPLAPYLDTVGL